MVPAIAAMPVEDLAAFLRKQIAAMTSRSAKRHAADAPQSDAADVLEE
jgi:hypothetical protein